MKRVNFIWYNVSAENNPALTKKIKGDYMKMKKYHEEIFLLKLKELEDEYDYMVATGNFPPELSNIATNCERKKSQINKEQNKK